MLRCQAQLELTLMMCVNDRFTSTSALNDRFTSHRLTRARRIFATVFFFADLLPLGVCVCVLQELKLSPPNFFKS